MTSTASRVIIDQWVVSVPVAPAPAPAAELPQLPTPAKRVYSEAVWTRARLLHPAPGYVTRAELDAIADELSAYTQEQRRQLRRKLQIGEYAEDEYSASGIYGPVGMCTPSRGDTSTGRG